MLISRTLSPSRAYRLYTCSHGAMGAIFHAHATRMNTILLLLDATPYNVTGGCPAEHTQYTMDLGITLNTHVFMHGAH